MSLRNLLSVVSMVAASAAWPADVCLVEKGTPRACLVVPAGAPKVVQAAAKELRFWTKELTGAELPMVETATAGLVPVTWRLGPTEGVTYDGFRLTASKSGVTIEAQEEYGLLFPVYWMLNRHGNVWWFDPESGADFTKTERFAIPAGTTLRNPLPDRCPLVAGGCPPAIRRQVELWNLRNGFVSRDNAILQEFGISSRAKRGGHSLGEMVVLAPVEKAELDAEIVRIKATGENKGKLNANCCDNKRTIEYLARYNLEVKKHPWRFPLIDGERCPTSVSLRGPYKGKVGNPCLSNPETREYLLGCIRAFKAEAVKNGAKQFEYGFMCDDNSQWCECDACMKLITTKGSSSVDNRASDYWWDFCNWMTPRLLEDPDMFVETAIYLTYRQPPTKVRPLLVDPARQSILICPHGRCYFHSLADRSCRQNDRYRKMFADWAQYKIPIRTFEYHCQLPGKGNYAFFEESWVRDLLYYREHGITHEAGGLFGPWMTYYGKGTEAYKAHPIYRFGAKARWQFLDLTGRFGWDPETDYQAIHKDILTRYYRCAAPEMLAYRQLLEEALRKVNICMSYGSSAMPFVVAMSDPALAPKAKALLRKASDKAKAAGDEELVRRIERDRENFLRDWEATAANASNVKTRRLARTTGKIVLDGVLDEPSWKIASVSDDWRWMKNYNVDAAQPDPYKPHTKTLLAADNENLYMAFVCDNYAGNPPTDIPDDKSTFAAMAGSHLEIAVQSPNQNGAYFHIALSHNGKTYSALTTNPTARDLKITCAFTFAIKDTTKGWIAEMALPLKDFGDLPKVGEIWRVGAYRCEPRKSGASLEGIQTGFPLHWMDRWEAYSFGEPGSVIPNGSFEFGAATPHSPYNGKNWTFRQSDAPAKWNYHQNGGDLDWREGDAAEGRRYIRVTPINKTGGPEFIVTPSLRLYRPDAKSFDIAFSARGKGYLLFYSFGAKNLEKFRVDIDSTEWKRYTANMPLTGTHPGALTVRFMSQKTDPIDFDDLSAVPK